MLDSGGSREFVARPDAYGDDHRDSYGDRNANIHCGTEPDANANENQAADTNASAHSHPSTYEYTD